MVRGRYIVLEGSEGCGKSTHAARLAHDLGAVMTRETGGTRIGGLVRAILHDTANTELTARAEALLIAGDRAQHVSEVIEPTLASGHHIVSDRSVYSSLAYQSFGRGLPFDDIRSINSWALGGNWPELVLFLEVPAAQLARRMGRRELDRFEAESSDFHQRVLSGFATMAAAEPERFVAIDASRPPDETAAAIRGAVRQRLGI
jgi:dTMP kinase